MRMTSQFSEMTSSAIFFDVVLFLLWSLVSYQYHWSRFHAIIITGSGVMIICFYKGLARNSEIGNTPSEFCSISGDCGNEQIPNLERTSLIKCYWMLQNAWVRTFTISELLRENQLGEGVNLPPTQPPAQIRVKHIAFFQWEFKSQIQTNFKRIEDAKVQKPWKEAFFYGTKIMQLLSYLILKFKIDFIYWGVSSCMRRNIFSSVKDSNCAAKNLRHS